VENIAQLAFEIRVGLAQICAFLTQFAHLDVLRVVLTSHVANSAAH
jgi:hypothetical protein